MDCKWHVVMQNDALVFRASDLYLIESKKVRSLLPDFCKVLISFSFSFLGKFKFGKSVSIVKFFFF